MEYILYLMFIMSILNGIMIVFRLFTIEDRLLRFGIWMRTLPLWFTISLALLVFMSLIKGTLENKDLLPIVFLYLALGYALYFVFRYKVFVKANKFNWFNGLKIRSVDGAEVLRINFVKSKFGNKINKIKFDLRNGSKTFRNDINAEWLVKIFAKENKILIEYE